jgi:hypothetical protein
MGSWPGWAISSAPPSCGKSFMRPGSIPRRGGPALLGRSFSAPRLTPSSPATYFISTRSPCTASTRSSSSSTPPAGAHPGRHRPSHRGLAHATGPQPVHGPRRRQLRPSVPHPRPRRQVHRGLRCHLHRHRRSNHQDAGPAATRERNRRALRRHRPPRAIRPDPDHQSTTRRSRALYEFERDYDDHRPHRSLGQAAPSRPLPHRAPTEVGKIQRRDRLGGLLHEYQQVA